ncbi:MAG TPA: hypothetical protein DCY42_09965 [Chloroflexi bacterium]|nr:hypothetical protein [Chloroflexota bacterium]
MSEEKQTHGTLRDEFRNLGENLKTMLSSAWESEERRKLQGELEEGMRELGHALDNFATEFQSGEVGQTIRREVDQFGERVRSGEVENKARQEILKALQVLNKELEKASDKLSQSEPGDDAQAE